MSDKHTAAETRNLFETAGKKQTAKDFKPAPDKITTNFGSLEFVGGAFPTADSAQKLYDELDLQRATQAYMDFYPALSVYGIVKAQIRDSNSQSPRISASLPTSCSPVKTISPGITAPCTPLLR